MITKYKYECQDCESTFNSKSKKRVCPNCKSKKISSISTPIITEVKKPSKEKNRLCRTMPVSIKTKVLDPGGFKNETEEFTKKVKFSVSMRRDEHEDIEITCSQCGRTFEVNPAYITTEEWKCDQCLINK